MPQDTSPTRRRIVRGFTLAATVVAILSVLIWIATFWRAVDLHDFKESGRSFALNGGGGIYINGTPPDDPKQLAVARQIEAIAADPVAMRGLQLSNVSSSSGSELLWNFVGQYTWTESRTLGPYSVVSRQTVYWVSPWAGVVPGLLVVMFRLGLGGWHRWDDWRRTQRIRLGQCACCGYDLRGTPERCPECGTGGGPATAAGG